MPVPIRVGVETFIDLAIAVVIDAVADLGSPRVDGRIAIVAIPLADRVAVVIGIKPFVDRAVAVVILAVAGLSCARVHSPVAVIAIPVAEPVAVAIHVLLVCGQQPVAVIVDPITELSRARIRGGHPVVAVIGWGAAGTHGKVAIAVRIGQPVVIH